MEWQRHINRKRGLAIQVCLAPMDFPQIIDLAFFMIITDMDTSLGLFNVDSSSLVNSFMQWGQ